MRVLVEQPAVFIPGVLAEPPPSVALVAVDPLREELTELVPALGLELAPISVGFNLPLDPPGLIERPGESLALLSGSSELDDIGTSPRPFLLVDAGGRGRDELWAAAHIRPPPVRAYAEECMGASASCAGGGPFQRCRPI